jgi:hypothetical protein
MKASPAKDTARGHDPIAAHFKEQNWNIPG